MDPNEFPLNRWVEEDGNKPGKGSHLREANLHSGQVPSSRWSITHKSRGIIVPDCLGVAKGLQSGVGLDDLIFQGTLQEVMKDEGRRLPTPFLVMQARRCQQAYLAWGLILLAAVPNGSNNSKILNDPLGVDSLSSSGFSAVVKSKGSTGSK